MGGDVAVISGIPFFADLTERENEAISRALIRKRFTKGQTIVHERDEENQTFFVIAEGVVHVVVLSAEGKRTILATLKSGDFFGEMALLDGEPRSASIVAAGDCELFMLYRRTFFEVLEQYPKIAVRMLVAMSRRLRRSNRHINTLSLMSVYGRVAEVLLQLGHDQGNRVGELIILENRPTHQVIADMAGTSRETVTRILSDLQKKRYISIDRKKLVILNEEMLYY